TDYPRPAVATHRGAAVSFAFSREISGGIQAFNQRHGVTLFMSMMAAWQTLLSRYSGQDDIIVGTDVANRNAKETEDLVGFFVNQLVIRSRFSEDLTFSELLRQVRTASLAAYEFQDLPFERLVEEVAPERDLSRAPIFQVKFVLQNNPG